MNFIIDGKEKNHRQFHPWLQNILALVKAGCDKPIALIIEQVSPNSKLAYLIENRKAKTFATLVKKRNSVTLNVSRKTSPNQTLVLVPQTELVLTLTDSIGYNTNEQYAKAILEHVCVQNDYWHGLVERIKIDNLPSVKFPAYGGRIIHVLEVNDCIDVLTESGVSHMLPKSLALMKQVEKHRYLVMRSNTDFQTVSPTEFQTYFQQV